MNRYADALLQCLLRHGLQILPRLRRSIVAGMLAPQYKFLFKPTGEPSFLLRRTILVELERP